MGVYEGLGPGMHWQQAPTHPSSVQSCGRIIPTPLYDPSRNSSPNLPCAQQEPMNPSQTQILNNNPSCCNFKREYSRGAEQNCHDCSQNNMYASRCSSAPSGEERKFSEERKYAELIEPKQEPPSNLDADEANVTCAGCSRRIVDRFYLYAVDQRWHVSCLQCSQCGRTLDGEMTCFCKDGTIYCKNDYYRIFGMKRCFRCQATISSTELVMRAQEYVYHVACFSCNTCSNILTKGDHFGMRDGLVYCRSHYQELPMISPDYDEHYTSPSPDYHHHHPHHHNHHHHHSIHSSETPSPSNPDSVKVNSFFNGAPTPRQKGRPRKRKPKDIDGLTANLDLNSDSYLDVFPGTPGLGGGNHQRTKRMRTSFKHHQLRTMKSYFAINHNPDAKDLKQLSQKTGLPKRVLQVWFQNARAKWRRLVMKQDGGSSKSGDKSCGENSNSGLDLDTYQLDSPEDSHYLSSPLECSS